jgi:hypothetical protein
MRVPFVTANRSLDFTPNPALSLPVGLRSSPHNDIGLVGEGLPLMLPRRGEAIGQTIVIIVQVFWSGVSCGPHVAILGLEVLGLRRRYQSEIVFGVLKIVLRGDRVASCVSVACQLKVSFRRRARTLAERKGDAGAILIRGRSPGS